MSRTRPLPSTVQFTQFLSRVVNLKEYSAAINLFKDICSLGVSVDEYTMSVAINSFCLAGRVDYGFSILGWFFKRGCSANHYTFSTLLKGLFREKRINEAQQLIRKMVGEGLCEINIVTCGIVVDGLCKVGNTSMAVEFLRTLEKGTLKPNAHIYNIVIDGLCKDRMIDSALALFNEMPEKGIPPNVVTYNSLIGGLCKDRMIDSALALLNEMPEKGIPPDVVTYNSLIGEMEMDHVFMCHNNLQKAPKKVKYQDFIVMALLHSLNGLLYS
ncbi:Unknown protein [Striga hermonthica]|uniref:Pentatricopeptide repeat-containing protein n=1 Tax=Striga hermonthica TaxID=68872 RepID=A0A9N7NMF3_STRHE|nr:Unknown protein [Striga hermonthica]